jgi:hypothetical protein
MYTLINEYSTDPKMVTNKILTSNVKNLVSIFVWLILFQEMPL